MNTSVCTCKKHCQQGQFGFLPAQEQQRIKKTPLSAHLAENTLGWEDGWNVKMSVCLKSHQKKKKKGQKKICRIQSFKAEAGWKTDTISNKRPQNMTVVTKKSRYDYRHGWKSLIQNSHTRDRKILMRKQALKIVNKSVCSVSSIFLFLFS